MSTTPTLLTRPPETTLIRPQRSLASDFIADAVIEETHLDEKIITQHPVEVGTTISDHAYDKPAELTLVYVWSMSSEQNSGQGLTFLRELYSQILNLKVNGTLFDVVTGKRSYKNMLIESIQTTTDKTSENILLLRIVCKEVIIVSTQTVTLSDPASQAIPEKTAPDVEQGQMQLQPGDSFNPNAPF